MFRVQEIHHKKQEGTRPALLSPLFPTHFRDPATAVRRAIHAFDILAFRRIP